MRRRPEHREERRHRQEERLRQVEELVERGRRTLRQVVVDRDVLVVPIQIESAVHVRRGRRDRGRMVVDQVVDRRVPSAAEFAAVEARVAL